MEIPSLGPAVFHLIPRFVAGEWFVKSERERGTYLVLLGDALKTTDWKCIAYAVMSNHIHLCVEAGLSPRCDWLRNAHAPFGAWINACNDRFGAVFADGMATWPVMPDEVAKVVAYIHNNPVRAGLVERASESAWTSHRAYLGNGARPRWLDVARGFALMGIGGAEAFDAFVVEEGARRRRATRPRGRPKTTVVAGNARY